MTLTELAASAGVAANTAWRWEADYAAPGIHSVVKILAQLGCTLDDLTAPITAPAA